MSHPEAMSYVIIISILQKKLRLREAGRLAQGLGGGRAGTWTYGHSDEVLHDGSIDGVGRGEGTDALSLEVPYAPTQASEKPL